MRIEYWDCDDNTERLMHEDFDEAIEAYLDDQVPGCEPEIIEVYGYARLPIDPAKFQEAILESAYDYLSERFDGEDGHKQNGAINDAAKKFVAAYLENYTAWGCSIVKTEKVVAKDWIQKNRPEWHN